MIFVTAMWATLILAALVLVFARSMGVELIASTNRLAGDQAAAVELGAEQWVLAQVDNTDGNADFLLKQDAEAVPVGKGYFWLLRPAADESSYEFGLTDEASKVNLNVAGSNQLIQLPGITNPIADCIVDWRDTDENVTNGDGAESSYYLNLPEPYKCKNAPLETVGELKLVKGIDDTILFGKDRNHNGVVDPGEQGQEAAAVTFNGSSPNRGIFPFVTVYTAEPNTDAQGMSRVNVNDQVGAAPGPAGQVPVPPKGAAPKRAAGTAAPGVPGTPAPTPGTGTESPLQQALQEGLSASRVSQIMALVPSKRPFSNLFDFAQKVQLSAQELRLVSDRLTWTDGRTLRGLINVNTAPREVLLTLPGLTQSDVDALISQRQSADTTSIAWVADALSMQKAATIGSLITNRSFFYSADIVAVSGDGRAFDRVRIVVDARQSPAKIVYRKDLTSLGWPLPQQIRDSLRNGKGPGSSPSVQGGMGRMGVNNP